MQVLVAYASKHGATAGIAERIGRSLESTGNQVDVRRVEDVDGASGYDAFVIGSATYMGHWRKEATEFARRLPEAAAGRPTWLFSSGPIGTSPTDAQGRDVRSAAEPKELPELLEALAAREHRVFFGALDPKELNFAERAMRKLPAAREALPEGDFRDWDDVDSWARTISDELAAV
jgi:menaquinone-dependent protoporphyrinogen oxidase